MLHRIANCPILLSVLSCLFAFLFLTSCQPGGELGSAPAAPQPSVVAGDKSARVSWDNVDGAARYNLYWFAAADASQRALQPSREVSSPLDVANLENGTTYYAALTAVGVGGESSYSNVIAITPQPPPSAPANIETTTAAESVTLHWPAVDGAASYKVYLVRSSERSAAGVVASPALIAVRETIDTSYVETGLDNGTEYSFVVTAINASGESVSSDLVTATPGPLKALSVGGGHACAVDAMGKLWCWGSNADGEIGDLPLSFTATPTPTNALKEWKTVAAGNRHACAIGSDESIVCWGSSLAGPITIAEGAASASPSLQQQWRSLSAGDQQSCAVRGDGSMWCWAVASSSNGSPELPTRIGFSSDWLDVEMGGDFYCARKQDLSLWCWGGNGTGQLGIGDNLSRRTPAMVDSPLRWVKVSVAGQGTVGGSGHACAIDSDAKLWCWGDNSRGALGDTSNDAHSAPVPIATSATWMDVSVGLGHGCGVQIDQSLWCWGSNEYGQLGSDERHDSLAPIRVGTENNWRSVAAGDEFTCAVKRDGAIWCLGRNDHGQLGVGIVASTTAPVPVMTDAMEVALAGNLSCALDSARRTWCWGSIGASPFTGGAGVPPYTELRRPIVVDRDQRFKSLIPVIPAGMCALNPEGALWCWGDTNENPPSMTPKALGLFGSWKQLAFSSSSACGLDAADGLWCWLSGSATPGTVPVFASLPDLTRPPEKIDATLSWNLPALSSSNYFNCDIDGLAQLWCWGARYTFDSAGAIRSRVQIADAQHWRSVAVGSEACAITQTGELWCWGGRYDVQQNSGVKVSGPETLHRVGTDSDWAVISTAMFRSCAIKADATLWCWGQGDNFANGYVSDINSTAALVPKQVGIGVHWKSVVSGYMHFCALADNNDLYCWGLNDVGQIGDGAAWSTEMRQVQFATP